jgi:hypothetical protein
MGWQGSWSLHWILMAGDVGNSLCQGKMGCMDLDALRNLSSI